MTAPSTPPGGPALPPPSGANNRKGAATGEVCGCYRCDEDRRSAAFADDGDFPAYIFGRRMILCPDCGNKRCPKSTDHRNPCTGSNEPNQQGSRYQYGPSTSK